MFKSCRPPLIFITFSACLLWSIIASAQKSSTGAILPITDSDLKNTHERSPLAQFSEEWNNPKYLRCNTASHAGYMDTTEQQVIYMLNLVRVNPKLFASTVLSQYPAYKDEEDMTNSDYYRSLLQTLSTMDSLKILIPDSLCFASARCHAILSGKLSYAGHDRKSKECRSVEHFMGECCDYGNFTALDIVLSLLIDQDVPSLGHREICLSPEFTKMGVAIQPHLQYKTNTVLDFY